MTFRRQKTYEDNHKVTLFLYPNVLLVETSNARVFFSHWKEIQLDPLNTLTRIINSLSHQHSLSLIIKIIQPNYLH